jgi:hypothetical protein
MHERFERLVRRGLLMHVALDDQVGFLEALLDVAEHGGLSGFGLMRELARVDHRHLLGRPLERLHAGADEDVAFDAAVG